MAIEFDRRAAAVSAPSDPERHRRRTAVDVRDAAPAVPAAISLADSAARRVSEMIRSGALRPGQRLPAERELAAQLGVSRGALREALRTLESVGLLQARVGSGRFVTLTSATDPGGGLSAWMQLQPVGDVIEVRRTLEPAAIAAIPAMRVDQTAAECRAILDRMTRAFNRGAHETAARIHTAFHLALVQYAPSRLMRVLLGSMIEVAEAAQLEIFRTPAAGRHSLDKHVWIVEALDRGDVEETARRVVSHLVPAFSYSPEDVDLPSVTLAGAEE